MPSTENIELQYEFTCVQFYEHAANADIEQASLALEKARMFTEIGLSPLLAFELEQMNEILNAKRKYKPKPKRKPDTKTAQTPWKVQCFGGLEMMRSGEVVKNIHWKRKKAQELFMFLLLRPHYSAQKEQVIEALFAQSDPEQVTNQLYVTVHRLKEILKQYLGGQPGIVTKDGIIRLDEQTIQSVDAEQYETLIRVGNQLWTTDRDLAMELYEKAYQLYAPLAPEVQYVDWLEQYRDKLLVMQTDIIRKLGQDALQKQRLERSELFFREWISLQPHHEEAYQHLIKLLLQSERRAEALYWYKLLEQVCVEELGTEPTEETRRMVLGTIL